MHNQDKISQNNNKNTTEDIYTSIANIIQQFNGLKTAKDVLDALKTKDAKTIEMLQFVYDEEGLSELAIKIVIQCNYYNKTGDIYYWVGSQPATQRYYLDRDFPSPKKDKWKRLYAITRQSQIESTFSLEALEEIEAIREKLQSTIDNPTTENQNLLKILLLNPIAEDMLNSNYNHTTEILKLLQESWNNKTINKDLYIQLSSIEKELFQACNTLYAFLLNPNQPIPRHTYYLLQDIIPYCPTPNLEDSFLNKDFGSQTVTQVWPITPHGKGIDANNKIATFEKSTQILPKNGKLYIFLPNSKKFMLACTTGITFKSANRNNEAGLVITMDGSIHIFKHTGGQENGPKHFHSMITGHSAVLFAGSIKIEDGEIKFISNCTGHYYSQFSLELLLFLQEKQLLHANITFEDSINKVRRISPYQIQHCIQSESGHASIKRYIEQFGKLSFRNIALIIEKMTMPKNQLCLKLLGDVFKAHYVALANHLSPKDLKIQAWNRLHTISGIKNSQLQCGSIEKYTNHVKVLLNNNNQCIEFFAKLLPFFQKKILDQLEGIPRIEDVSLNQYLVNQTKYKKYYSCKAIFHKLIQKSILELKLNDALQFLMKIPADEIKRLNPKDLTELIIKMTHDKTIGITDKQPIIDCIQQHAPQVRMNAIKVPQTQQSCIEILASQLSTPVEEPSSVVCKRFKHDHREPLQAHNTTTNN